MQSHRSFNLLFPSHHRRCSISSRTASHRQLPVHGRWRASTVDLNVENLSPLEVEGAKDCICLRLSVLSCFFECLFLSLFDRAVGGHKAHTLNSRCSCLHCIVEQSASRFSIKAKTDGIRSNIPY